MTPPTHTSTLLKSRYIYIRSISNIVRTTSPIVSHHITYHIYHDTLCLCRSNTTYHHFLGYSSIRQTISRELLPFFSCSFLVFRFFFSRSMYLGYWRDSLCCACRIQYHQGMAWHCLLPSLALRCTYCSISVVVQ